MQRVTNMHSFALSVKKLKMIWAVLTVFVSLSVSGQESIQCNFSDEVKTFINGSRKIHIQGLWLDFPRGYRQAFGDFTTDSRIYLIATSAEVATANIAAQECTNYRGVFRTSDTLPPETNSYYLYCDSGSPTCDSLPSVKTFWQRTALRVSVDRFNSLRHQESLKNMFGRNIYRGSELALEGTFHEHFHGFQNITGYNTVRKNLGKFRVISECRRKLPEWEKRYKLEQQYWISILPRLYSLQRFDAYGIARDILQLRTWNQTPEDRDCYLALAEQERHEGVAHFIGNQAQLIAGSTPGRIGALDIEYIRASGGPHNLIEIYATGAGITQLINALDPTQQWKQQIQNGKTPIQLLQELLVQR